MRYGSANRPEVAKEMDTAPVSQSGLGGIWSLGIRDMAPKRRVRLRTNSRRKVRTVGPRVVHRMVRCHLEVSRCTPIESKLRTKAVGSPLCVPPPLDTIMGPSP